MYLRENRFPNSMLATRSSFINPSLNLPNSKTRELEEMANHAKRLVMSTLTARSRCFSTEKAPETAVSLFRKLAALTTTDGGVADTLDEWVKQGNNTKRYNIIGCVNQLRKFKKYHHALQIYEWMEKGKIKMNNVDHAVCIDLLAKTKGVSSAEEYFNNLEESSKTLKTYGALLSCYCKEKMIDEAADLFERIKELSFASTLNYNNVMSLYLSIGEPDKVLLLAKEMEGAKIAADKYTYNHLMKGFASMKEYDAAEGVLERMRKDKVTPDWFTYVNLAAIYVDAGLIDKANATLQKLGSMRNVHDCEAYHSLIYLYARLSDLSGVNRAWESLKLAFPKKPKNVSYLVMLSALLKLDDVNGLQKCFSEWESGCSTYDVRLANVILESYLNRNMIEEANALYENMGSREVEPSLRTLDLFMNYYLSNHQRKLALEFFEMGVTKVCSEKIKGFPTDQTVNKFLELLDEEKDEEAAEKFRERVKEIERLRT